MSPLRKDLEVAGNQMDSGKRLPGFGAKQTGFEETRIDLEMNRIGAKQIDLSEKADHLWKVPNCLSEKQADLWGKRADPEAEQAVRQAKQVDLGLKPIVFLRVHEPKQSEEPNRLSALKQAIRIVPSLSSTAIDGERIRLNRSAFLKEYEFFLER